MGLVTFCSGWLAARAWLDDSEAAWITPTAVGLAVSLMLVVLSSLASRLALADFLERQLCGLASATHGTVNLEALELILPRSSATQGWNALVGAARDRIADQALERREAVGIKDPMHEQLVRGLRSLPDGLAITDRQGMLQYCNLAWNLLAGLPADEDILAKPLIESLHMERFVDGAEQAAAILSGNGPLTLKLQLTNDIADGVLQLSRVPLDGRVQDSAGFVWQLRDVTQQSLANQSHEQFLGSATHELRTPITNIRAYAESLADMENATPEQRRGFFNVITNEAIRLGRLLDDLLNLQQLQAGSMTLQSANFDVQRMLHEVEGHIQPLVEERGLKLVSRIAPNVKPIYADKEKLTACLINLLGNAVKYTLEGEIRLIAEQVPGALVISVEDTGIGIASENLPKLFDRFFRCADERVQQVEGNGLGLAFAREVVALHNGQLTVESELNQGSRFTIRIPLPSH